MQKRTQLCSLALPPLYRALGLRLGLCSGLLVSILLRVTTLPSAIVAYRDRQIRGSFGQCFARFASMPMTRLFENNSWNCRTR